MNEPQLKATHNILYRILNSNCWIRLQPPWIIELLAAVLISFGVAYSMVPKEYWLDWDTQRYAVQVMISQQGDGEFSFMHNLLKSWLFHAANLLTPILHEFQPIQGARWLTIFFSGTTALLIFGIIRSLTRSTVAALAACVLWLVIPGNISLMMTLEDNVWSNAFNTAFLWLTITLAGYPHRRPENSLALLLLSCVLGGVLSIGMNLHQQLAINFYAFFGLMCLTHERRWKDVIRMCAGFCAGYLAISAAQNYIAFGDLELMNSVRRLYHQPYVASFPNLYYFTSGASPGDWASLIATGWKKTLFFDARRVPLWTYLTLLPILSAIYVVIQGRSRGTLFCLYQFRLLLFLSAACIIHIPHSLFFEPANIERWDSVLPGLLVLSVVLAHMLLASRSQWAPQFPIAKRLASVMAICLVCLSLFQGWRYNRVKLSEYNNHPAIIGLREIISHLAKHPENSERHVVVLDSLYEQNDIQASVTYFFPHVSVFTVDRRLNVLYSSMDLQHRTAVSHLFPNIQFPESSHFSVTQKSLDWLTAQKVSLAPCETIPTSTRPEKDVQ